MKKSAGTVAHPAKPPPVRRRWLVRALLGVVVAVAAGWIVWQQLAPVPPLPDCAGCDPEVSEAVVAARRNVQLWPWSADRWGRLGMILLAHDFYHEALICFERAQEYDAAEMRWPYYRGLIYLFENPEASLPCFQRAAALSEAFAPRQRLAEELLREERLDDAEKALRRNSSVPEVAPYAIMGLGQVALKRGDLNGAITLLTQAAASPLVRKHAYNSLAMASQLAGDSAAAAQFQQKAADLPDDPGWVDPYQNETLYLRVGPFGMSSRAIALQTEGKMWQAIALMEELVRKYPDYTRVYLELGKSYMTVHDLAASERHLKEGIRRQPDFVQAHMVLGGVLQMQDRLDEALVHLREAVRLKPDSFAAYMGIGNCLVKKGDSKGAMAAFTAALRYQPDVWQGHLELGRLLAQDGRDAEALAHLQQAVRLAPANERAKKALQEVEARAKPR